MKKSGNPVVWSLDEDACWNLVTRCPVGRLAVVVDGHPDIFPVNHVVHGNRVLFRTAQGSKLADIAANSRVAFEVDELEGSRVSSAVLKGLARRLQLQSEIDVADALPLASWIPTLKYHWVEISSSSITGRRFVREAEPVRYAASQNDERT